MCLRQVVSQNGEYVENFCIDVENPLLSASQKWFNQLN